MSVDSARVALVPSRNGRIQTLGRQDGYQMWPDSYYSLGRPKRKSQGKSRRIRLGRQFEKGKDAAMRRIIAVAAACFFAASLISPASGAQSEREVTKEYTMADGMVILDSTHAAWTLGTAWKVFRPNAGERFVSFTASDDTDQSVYVHVHVDANGDGKNEHLDFCTETPEPIRLGATRKIDVAVFLGTCPGDTTPSVVTQGTITATFTR